MPLWSSNPLLYNVCVRQGLQKVLSLYPDNEAIAKTLYRCRVMGYDIRVDGLDIFVNNHHLTPTELSDYATVVKKILRDIPHH